MPLGPCLSREGRWLKHPTNVPLAATDASQLSPGYVKGERATARHR